MRLILIAVVSFLMVVPLTALAQYNFGPSGSMRPYEKPPEKPQCVRPKNVGDDVLHKPKSKYRIAYGIGEILEFMEVEGTREKKALVHFPARHGDKGENWGTFIPVSELCKVRRGITEVD